MRTWDRIFRSWSNGSLTQRTRNLESRIFQQGTDRTLTWIRIFRSWTNGSVMHWELWNPDPQKLVSEKAPQGHELETSYKKWSWTRKDRVCFVRYGFVSFCSVFILLRFVVLILIFVLLEFLLVYAYAVCLSCVCVFAYACMCEFVRRLMSYVLPFSRI